MNIAFDAGAIEIGKGSGVGNYTLHQFEHLMRLYPEHNFYYFNVIEEYPYADRLSASNLHKRYFYLGKDQVLRHYEGEYQDVFGSIVRNFIIQNQIDVFYITAPFLTSPDIGFNVIYKKEWFNGINVVATVYDVIPYVLKKQYLSSKETYNWYMHCIDALRFADRLLVISNSVKDDMSKLLGFDSEKIDVIYGGVSDKYRIIEIPQRDQDALYSKWGINGEFILCCVSADWRKNTEGAIKAYALLPEELRSKYQMVIAGRLADKSRCEKDLQNLGLEGRVILTDYIPNDDELVKIYNLAKIIIIPSFYEGFGLPVIEAWACGKAVLASNNSSLAEIVGETGLLFDPHDVNDMAQVLTTALTSAHLQDLASRGYAKLSFYTWDNVAKFTMEAIKKLPIKDMPTATISAPTIGSLDDDSLGIRVKAYLEGIIPPAPIYDNDRIIVADVYQKKELQTTENLGKVYAINPMIGHYPNVSDTARKKIMQTTQQNFASALSHKSFLKNPDDLLNRLKTQEIDTKSYTLNEARKLVATVSYALGTESIRKTLTRAEIGLEDKPIKVAMVTSWNVRCGIAEYTKYFIEHVESIVNIEVWPNIVTQGDTSNILDDERVVLRTWEYKGDVTDLIKGLHESRPDIIHLQYTEGFFTLSGLVKIIQSVIGKIILTCHNTKFLKPENKHQLSILNKAHFIVHQKKAIKELVSFGFDPSHIIHIPLGQISVPDRNKECVRQALQLKGSPIIGSYGFLLPHKNILQIIEAVSILKEKYPNIKYLACNALHTVPASKEYFDQCKGLINKLQLNDNVIMIPDFLNPQESIYLLQACDMLVMPYSNNLESASGAVRFCIAAKRPLVLTDQPIFKDVKEASILIKDDLPASIAKGIERLLDEGAYNKCKVNVNNIANSNNWEDIAEKYLDIYFLGKEDSLDIERHKGKFGVNISPVVAKPLVSSLSRRQDLVVFSNWVLQLKQEHIPHNRKVWEWVYVAQALYERDMLKSGKRGLGFAVGTEPLPALFAKFGATIIATDLGEESDQVESWKAVNGHASSLSALEYPEICDIVTLHKNVKFMPCDMNKIPESLEGFDFCWSNCAFEHIGNVQQGRDFLINSLKTLKPGGVSVHTTEFNLSSEDNETSIPYCIAYGKKFFDDISKEIKEMGHYFAPLDYRLGDHPADDYVYKWGEPEPHFKVMIGDSVATSFGIIIVKGIS